MVMGSGLKERIDQLLVDRGLADSRKSALSLVMSGLVIADGEKISKAGTMVEKTAEIRLTGKVIPYVGRGGIKLEAALDAFFINPKGMTAMDVGASTGGFTDCLLKRGARKVYAIDVGYGLLAWSLRTDPRVVTLERKNIREMEREEVGEEI
ncbi:MAG: SAM-dependent methyltransferase, partial [Nitrospirota bacterium]